MIETLIIMNAGGVCIYNKNMTSSKLDEQLLSGFLTALSNFSSEVIKEGELQKIDARDKKIITYQDKNLGLIVAAICDSLDYDLLLLKLLKNILKEFDKQFHDVLNDPRISTFTEKFDEFLEKKLLGNIANRKNNKVFLGVVLGELLILILFFLQAALFTIFTQNFIISIVLSTEVWDILIYFSKFSFQLQLIIVGSFALPALIAGYIAGSRKRGLYVGFLLTLVSLVISFILFIIQNIIKIKAIVFMIYSVGLFILTITYLPVILILMFIFCYLGGLLKDKGKLYPLSSRKMNSKREQRTSGIKNLIN